MSSNRRDFLIGTASAGAAAPWLAHAAPAWAATPAGSSDTVVVYVQCRGGYDYLNLLIPADDTVYYQARPNIGIPKANTLGEVDPGTGVYWHTALQSFKDLYDRDELAVAAYHGGGLVEDAGFEG